ncbi:MAG: prepilin-type N-terminal cleavage/methylation domain-containing protein [Patescibacteria group bacterium]
MDNKPKKQKGFSLIELILYLGLLAFLFSVLFVFFQQTIYAKAKINDKIELVDSGQFALNKIVWYLKQAESVNSPAIGQSQNTLSLNLADQTQNPIEFLLENNVLLMKISSNQTVALTSSRIKVNQITFSNFAFSANSPIIQIQMELASASQLWKNQPIKLQTSVNISHLGAGDEELGGEQCSETEIILQPTGNIIAPKGDLELKVVGSEITYGAGGPQVDVDSKIWLDNNLLTLFGGEPVNGGELYTASLSARTNVAVRAHAQYRTIFSQYYDSNTGSPHVKVLKDGDDLPNTPVFGNQTPLPALLAPFIDANRKISILDKQILMLFEFGDLNSAAADFQDLVVLFTFTPDNSICN